MAKMTIDGLDIMRAQLEAHGAKVEGTINHMLNAGAKILKEETQKAMNELDIKDKGDLIKSIKSSGIKTDKESGSKSIEIAPSGKDRKGVRNMTKAMIAEYGKKGIPARPWKTLAEERGYPRARERMQEIFNEAMGEE